MGHTIREFLGLPLAVIAVWMVVGTAAISVDRGSAPWHQEIQQQLATVVPPSATSSLLETVTPGLLTVVSIIFFVLLMAVQHQSSTYTPVVLDQFLRRRTNQLFFGGFVGLSMYCLLALALVPPGKALTSAAIALLLTVVTFGLLLVFVYSTVDQMRPSSTMWMIQLLALRARAKQRAFLLRCRKQPQLEHAPSQQVISGRVGYVVDIDANTLTAGFDPEQTPAVEAHLTVALGDHVVPGTLLAEVRGERADQRQRLADAVLDAITLGRMRNIDNDAGHAIDHLGSMAWSATATSGDPEGARLAVETLHTLLICFEQEDHSTALPASPLPVVYHDAIVHQTLDALTNVVPASGASGQQQTCSNVLTVLSDAIPQLSAEHQQMAVERLQRVLPVSIHHIFTINMEHAFRRLRHAVDATGMHKGAQRLAQIEAQLTADHTLASPQAQTQGANP